MTAVAVWDHAPDADELLRARLARGWAPTPTGTRDGPKILGHASKLGGDPPDPPPQASCLAPSAHASEPRSEA